MEKLREADTVVLVASHLEPIYRELEAPYLEICVPLSNGPVQGYRHYVDKNPGLGAHPESLSELNVLLGARQFFKGRKQVGLNHYRRIFLLSPDEPEDQDNMRDFKTRYSTAVTQANFLQNYVNNIVIPKPMELNSSMYEHFIACHAPLEQALDVACLAFDESVKHLFGIIDSKSDLKSSKYIYPWNMWIGSLDFYDEWVSLLFPVLKALDDISDSLPKEGFQSRWSGFISERLFTVYINYCRGTNRWNFVERPVIFFEDIAAAERDIAAAERDIAAAERDIAAAERDVAELSLERLLKSKSWTSTKFLRVADRILKRVLFSTKE
jgi:hypothetical protein